MTFDGASSAVRAEYVDDGFGGVGEDPQSEIVGSDDMYIPTTQIRIKVDGEWHRRGPIPAETACGKTYRWCASREYQLKDDLCEECSTPRERFLLKHPELVPARNGGDF